MVGDTNYTFLGYYIFKILVSDLRQARVISIVRFCYGMKHPVATDICAYYVCF
jgi:hypothetical protein